MQQIIHLDDHRLFLKGLKNLVLEKFPYLVIINFTDNISAWDYVNECLKNEVPIDLIITDYQHPSAPSGLEFAESVRTLESGNSKRIPIMMLTMCEKNKSITKAMVDGVVDAYFSKAASEEDLIEYIKKVVSD